jgi:alanyl-tRNA synthetase
MNSKELRQKFLDFMAQKGHYIIPSSSLVPKEDPTVLFIGSGMQPMLPYLLGLSEHPKGKKIVDSQKCIRTVDIDEVGDNRHCTFFEMLGNWSLGDYFKEESIKWSFEFLTSKNWLGLDPKRIFVTVYKGNKEVPADLESIEIWKEEFSKVGIEPTVGEEVDFSSLNSSKDFKLTRITQKSAKENWWDLPQYGPCGGDTEIFYVLDDVVLDFETSILPNLSLKELEDFYENKIIEIWNNVFMEYEGIRKSRDEEPSNLKPLKNKNVDTGMGFERILAVINQKTDVYETDVFVPILEVIQKYSNSN